MPNGWASIHFWISGNLRTFHFFMVFCWAAAVRMTSCGLMFLDDHRLQMKQRSKSAGAVKIISVSSNERDRSDSAKRVVFLDDVGISLFRSEMFVSGIRNEPSLIVNAHNFVAGFHGCVGRVMVLGEGSWTLMGGGAALTVVPVVLTPFN